MGSGIKKRGSSNVWSCCWCSVENNLRGRATRVSFHGGVATHVSYISSGITTALIG